MDTMMTNLEGIALAEAVVAAAKDKKPDEAILALPPTSYTTVVETLGADGRICRATVFRTLSSPRWFDFPNHPEDSGYTRDILSEEVLAYSTCTAAEVTPVEFAAIRAKQYEQAEKVKGSAAKARAAVGEARQDAIAALAKNAGLTAEQTEALFGRSLSPVFKEVVEAVAKKR